MERKKSAVINDAIYYLSKVDELDPSLIDELFDIYYMLKKTEEQEVKPREAAESQNK